MKKKSQYKEGNFGAIYKFDHGYLCNLAKFSDCQDKLRRVCSVFGLLDMGISAGGAVCRPR